LQIPFGKDNYLSNVPVNWFAAADDDKKVILYGAPGLSVQYTCPAAAEVRGMKVAGEFLYVACGDKVYQLDANWGMMELGTLSTSTGKVWIEYNGSQVAFLAGSYLYTYTILTGVFAIVSDTDFPGAATLTYQDGYGVINAPGTNQFYLSGIYDFTSWNALDFASAEGWPDNIEGVLMNYRELWLFGEDTTEVWYNSGDTFPFTRIQGGFIEQGCRAPGSIAKGDNVVYWLASTRQVMLAEGYQPRIISTRKMEREVDNYTRVDDALSWVQVFEGHTFYWLTFPTEKVTWVYDAATKLWHKRTSYPDYDRHRANCYAYFQNQHIVGDYQNGKLYHMDSSYYDDAGEELLAVVESPQVRSEGKRQFFAGLEVQFDHGQVDVSVTPYAVLEWSDDNGNNWSNEYWAVMGDLGEYGKRATWRRLGSSYNRIFKLSVSDPVNRNILSVNWI
jgi:hypothetical protein